MCEFNLADITFEALYGLGFFSIVGIIWAIICLAPFVANFLMGALWNTFLAVVVMLICFAFEPQQGDAFYEVHLPKDENNPYVLPNEWVEKRIEYLEDTRPYDDEEYRNLLGPREEYYDPNISEEFINWQGVEYYRHPTYGMHTDKVDCIHVPKWFFHPYPIVMIPLFTSFISWVILIVGFTALRDAILGK